MQYNLSSHPTPPPLHPPKSDTHPPSTKTNQFSILHAFLLSLENPCQVQKKLHNQKMDPYRYNGEKYFSFRIGIFFIIPYYNVAQNSLKYWYSQFINSMQNKNVLSELKQNQTDRKIVHIIIIIFSSILLA